MDSEEGTQQPHLVLANKLFLLRHPDVQDIEKVRLKDEVFAAVKSDGNSPLIPLPSHSSDSISQYFLFCVCRYGSVVRIPSRRFGVRERSGASGLYAREDRRRD
jgi:hypothetical protein